MAGRNYKKREGSCRPGVGVEGLRSPERVGVRRGGSPKGFQVTPLSARREKFQPRKVPTGSDRARRERDQRELRRWTDRSQLKQRLAQDSLAMAVIVTFRDRTHYANDCWPALRRLCTSRR